MAVMETVRHTGTVIHELHHVTTEVRLLIDAQSVGASILWEQKTQRFQQMRTSLACECNVMTNQLQPIRNYCLVKDRHYWEKEKDRLLEKDRHLL